jgi:hypothetical protein
MRNFISPTYITLDCVIENPHDWPSTRSSGGDGVAIQTERLRDAEPARPPCARGATMTVNTHRPPREGETGGKDVLTQLTSVDGVMQSPGPTDVPFIKYRGWIMDFDAGPEGDRFKLEEASAEPSANDDRGRFERWQRRSRCAR